MLEGKAAIVTGSTGGIGLRIATVFATQGAAIMLNAFGDSDLIETTRARLERQHGVRVRCSAAGVNLPW